MKALGQRLVFAGMYQNTNHVVLFRFEHPSPPYHTNGPDVRNNLDSRCWMYYINSLVFATSSRLSL